MCRGHSLTYYLREAYWARGLEIGSWVVLDIAMECTEIALVQRPESHLRLYLQNRHANRTAASRLVVDLGLAASKNP